MLTVGIALAPGVVGALAQAPEAAAPDPAVGVLKAYDEALNTKLGTVLARLDEFPRRKGSTSPFPPGVDAPLEWWQNVGVLGALSPLTRERLQAQGDHCEAAGSAADAAAPIPAEFAPFEHLYVGKAPVGLPIRGASKLLEGLPPDAVEQSLTEHLDGMTLHEKDAPPPDGGNPPAAWAELERLVRTHVHQVVAEALRQAKVSLPGQGKDPDPATAGPEPWKSLGSKALEARVLRYRAERYFRGRWTSRPGSAATPPSVDGAFDKGTDKGDGGSGGGTGDGVGRMPEGVTGTGSGKSDAVPSAAGGTGGTGDGRVAKPVPPATPVTTGTSTN